VLIAVSFIFFQMRSHHSLYDEVFRSDLELIEEPKESLTLPEALIAVFLGLTCVTFMAIFLVDEIEFLVQGRHIKDA
jgi:Ca2+:H+ antiporter